MFKAILNQVDRIVDLSKPPKKMKHFIESHQTPVFYTSDREIADRAIENLISEIESMKIKTREL